MRRLATTTCVALTVSVLPALSAAAPAAATPPSADVPAVSHSAPAIAASAPAAKARVIRLGGVRVRVKARTRQVVTVNRRSGHHARTSLWRKKNGRWHRTSTARDGRIGYGGLVKGSKRKQGTGTTPRGTYSMTSSFGNAKKPGGTRLPFHRTHRGDYWVQDNASKYYNQRRHRSAGGFRWWLPTSDDNSSERLREYGKQYAWSIVIDFNRPNPVRRRGSGIFLHVNGSGATAGCVSAPRKFVQQTLRRLRPRLRPVIAIGR